jgi:hypothetical protein
MPHKESDMVYKDYRKTTEVNDDNLNFTNDRSTRTERNFTKCFITLMD